MTKTYNWVGDSTQGGSGDWNTASDWSPGEPPAFANVNFAIGGNPYTVTGDGNQFFVENLSVGGDNVTFSNLMIDLAQNLTAAAGSTVTIDPTSEITGNGTLSFAAGSTLEVQGQFMDFANGTLSFAAGSTLEVQGQFTDLGSGAFTVDLLEVDGIGAYFTAASPVTANQIYVFDNGTFASDILLNDGGAINMDNTAGFGGTLTLAGNASLYESTFTGLAAAGTFGDDIAFQKTGGVLYVASDPGLTLVLAGTIGVGSNSNGFLNITGGTVELSGANNPLSGGVVVDTSATLQIDTVGAAGTGGIFLADGNLDVAGAQSHQVVVAAAGNDAIYGAGGGLIVYASNAATLTFQGGSTGSVVYGGSGVLDATGGSGGDTIFAGTSGHDVLITGTGPTTLAGANADLVAVGGAGNLLAAAGGNTTLNGSTATGNNVMFGATGGNTTIEGGFGTDTICGLAGAATVYASQGTNDIFAGSGTLQVDFVLGFGGGTTNIIGFNAAQDHLHTSGLGANPVSAITDINGNTVITLNDHSTIVLWGVASLPTGVFV